MNSILNLPQNVREALRCPACRDSLAETANELICSGCSQNYPITDAGSPDLRLRSPKQVSIDVQIGPEAIDLESQDGLKPFQPLKTPEVKFAPQDVREHIDSNLLTHFTKAKQPSEMALDLGCGANSIHRPLIEKCGYTYVGLDYSRPGAPVLGDAHALPFEHQVFSFAISVAVLEHLAHPVVALKEVHRALKPGARFIGSVAFLEPFHSNSFYHHTHRGLANGLLQAGFEILHLGYHPNWSAPFSLSKKFFPKLGDRFGKPLVWPLYAGSFLFWKLGSFRSGNKKLMHMFRRDLAGSFLFSCQKPSS